MVNVNFTGTSSASNSFLIDKRGLIQGALYNNADTPAPVRKAVFVRAMPLGTIRTGGTAQDSTDILATTFPCFPGMPLQVRLKSGAGTLSGTSPEVEYEAHYAYENLEWPGTNFTGAIAYEPKINAFAVANEAMINDNQSAPQADFGAVINFVFITDGAILALPFAGTSSTLDRVSADFPLIWDKDKGALKYDASTVTGKTSGSSTSAIYGLGRTTILKRSEYQNIFYAVNIQSRAVYKSSTQGGYSGLADTNIGDPAVKTLLMVKFR